MTVKVLPTYLPAASEHPGRRYSIVTYEARWCRPRPNLDSNIGRTSANISANISASISANTSQSHMNERISRSKYSLDSTAFLSAYGDGDGHGARGVHRGVYRYTVTAMARKVR